MLLQLGDAAGLNAPREINSKARQPELEALWLRTARLNHTIDYDPPTHGSPDIWGGGNGYIKKSGY